MAIITANNQSMTAITSLSGVTVGNLVLLSTETASSDSTIDFTSNIDSTYKEYIFKYYDLNPETDRTSFVFNLTTDGTNFNVTKTTTMFRTYNDETDSYTALQYQTSQDLAQATGFQDLTDSIGNDNDTAACGYLHLFNPSSTTFVKHFIAQTILPYQDELAWHGFISGYFNTTSAITAIQFKMDSGNIDAGDICLYGIL